LFCNIEFFPSLCSNGLESPNLASIQGFVECAETENGSREDFGRLSRPCKILFIEAVVRLAFAQNEVRGFASSSFVLADSMPEA
jgi:hypothetical protein